MLGKDMRTDRHFNPTALIWTPGVERFFQSIGFKVGKGDPFVSGGKTYYTADFSDVSDPVAATVAYIDRYGFYTGDGKQRWEHTAMSKSTWDSLTYDQKRQVVRMMYQREGGSKLFGLFEGVVPTTREITLDGMEVVSSDVSRYMTYELPRLDRGNKGVLVVAMGVLLVILLLRKR